MRAAVLYVSIAATEVLFSHMRRRCEAPRRHGALHSMWHRVLALPVLAQRTLLLEILCSHRSESD